MKQGGLLLHSQSPVKKVRGTFLEFSKKFVRQISFFLLMMLVLAIAASFLGKYHWLFDLFAHFMLPYLILSVILSIYFAVTKQWRPFAVGILILSITASQIFPFYAQFLGMHRRQPLMVQAENQTIKVMLLNVLTSNTQYDQVLAYITLKDPDVIVLEEVDARWAKSIQPLAAKTYPHHLIHAREDNFGILLLSKFPLKKPEVKFYGEAQLPSIKADISLLGKSITIFGTHPLPPISAAYSKLRNDQLQAIAAHRADFAESLMLLGDLNTTSYSVYFKAFIKQMGLYDSREGQGIQASWNLNSRLLQVPIDHILLTQDIDVLKREIGPDVGSDHRPIFAELRLYRQKY